MALRATDGAVDGGVAAHESHAARRGMTREELFVGQAGEVDDLVHEWRRENQLPRQNRCFSPRMNMRPLLMAGEAKVFSPIWFCATSSNSRPARTTFITP